MEKRTAIVISVIITAIIVGSATYLMTPKGGDEELTVDDVKTFVEEASESTVKDILSVVSADILMDSLPEPEPVKIGQIWPLSGGQKRSGEKHQRGFELRVKEVNDDGGIKSLRGAKIEFVTGNNQGDPSTSRSEAERLISQQNASALVGCYTSDTTTPTAEICQREEVPLMVCAGSPAIPATGDYIHRAHNGIFETVDVSLKFLREETDVQKISLLMEDAGYGPPAFSVTQSFAEKMGFEIVSAEKFPAGKTSFQSELLKIKEADPDALIWVGYVSESIAFVQQMKQYDVNVDALIQPGGGGLNDIDFVEEVGSLANYCLVGTYYSKAAPTFHNEEFKQRYEEEYGQSADFLAEEAYEATAVLLDAIERAGSRDPADIRDAIADTHMVWTAGPIVFGEHQYAPDQFGTGFNTYNNSVVVQVQNGEFQTVYPAAVATSDPQLPMPNWNER